MEDNSKNSFLTPFLIILSAVAIFFVGRKWWLWYNCEKGCPSSGMLMPCAPKKCDFWTGKPKNNFPTNPKEGDTFIKGGVSYSYNCVQPACITAPCNPVCVWQPVVVQNNTNTNNSNNSNNNTATSQDDLEVSNPAGAYLYYQSLSPASGGMIYGKSNVVVPVGTKLKSVKFWQTNLSTQPLGGYWETTYQPNVAMNGFFDYKDIKKI